jgi:hypothetical protein
MKENKNVPKNVTKAENVKEVNIKVNVAKKRREQSADKEEEEEAGMFLQTCIHVKFI